jgi:hypothetical protein
MNAIILLALGAYLIGVLRYYPGIDEHDEVLLDAEYEKQ